MVQATTTQGKHHSTIPKKKKPKTNSKQSNQNYCNFQTNLNKTASAQNIEKLYKNANLQNFRKLNHPYTMKIALIKTKSEKITPLQDMNHPSIVKKTYKTKPQS